MRSVITQATHLRARDIETLILIFSGFGVAQVIGYPAHLGEYLLIAASSTVCIVLLIWRFGGAGRSCECVVESDGSNLHAGRRVSHRSRPGRDAASKSQCSDRVLVVGGHARDLGLRRILEREGHSVFMARDVQQDSIVCEGIKSGAFGVVLVRGTDWPDTLRKIRSSEPQDTEFVPVILLITEGCAPIAQDLAMELDGCVTSPARRQALISAVYRATYRPPCLCLPGVAEIASRLEHDWETMLMVIPVLREDGRRLLRDIELAIERNDRDSLSRATSDLRVAFQFYGESSLIDLAEIILRLGSRRSRTTLGWAVPLVDRMRKELTVLDIVLGRAQGIAAKKSRLCTIGGSTGVGISLR